MGIKLTLPAAGVSLLLLGLAGPAHAAHRHDDGVSAQLAALQAELDHHQHDRRAQQDAHRALAQALAILQQHRLHPGAGPAGPGPARWQQTERACDSLLPRQHRQACVASLVQSGHDPWSVVKACDWTFHNNADELACVQAAAQARRDPAPAIKRCDWHFGPSHELGCVRAATRAAVDPVKLIDRCESMMTGDAAELACLETASQLRGDVWGVLTHCEQELGQANELLCLERYRDVNRPRRGRGGHGRR